MPPSSRSRLSARYQQPTTARSTAAAVSSQPTTVLPPYEPPLAPLNRNAIYALSVLPTKHPVAPVKDLIGKATETLTDVAAGLSDYLARKQRQVESRRARREREDEPVQGEEEAGILKEKIDTLVDLIDEKVRTMVDTSEAVDAGEKVLKEIHQNVAAAEGRTEISATQSTLGASQFRTQRNGDEEDDEGSHGGVGVMKLMRKKIEDRERSYKALSKSARYAQHNDYIGFKKSVHDAKYLDDNAPPLPHANTWFPDEATRNSSGGESDSDLETISERISIKCPITLLPMKQPVTSKKCKHSFEREAILEMISHSPLNQDGSTGRQRGSQRVPALQCPVCTVILTAADVYLNHALLRQIKRVQAREREEEASNDDDDEESASPQKRRHVEAIHSDYEPVDDSTERSRMISAAIKTEDLSGRVPKTQVPNAADDDDDDDEEMEQQDDEVGENEDEEDEEEEDEEPARHAPPASSAMVIDVGDSDEEDDEDMEES